MGRGFTSIDAVPERDNMSIAELVDSKGMQRSFRGLEGIENSNVTRPGFC